MICGPQRRAIASKIKAEIESAAQRVYKLLTARKEKYSTKEEEQAHIAEADAEFLTGDHGVDAAEALDAKEPL